MLSNKLHSRMCVDNLWTCSLIILQLEERQSGKEFERLKHKSDRQRLAFAVKKIFNIKLCWDELVTQGPIPTRSFDDDSLRVIREYKNYMPFEPVFRLLPDMLVKGFKLVELSKIWYNSARRLGGVEPASYHSIRDFFEQVELADRGIKMMDEEHQRYKEQRISKQTERKLLVNQILRFDEVKEKYERCVEREKELKDYYKQLKVERNSEYPKLDKLPRDHPDYKETYEQIQYLAESMKGVYRELQTASYELELVKQDYAVGMANRTNLIHVQNDVKSSIQDIDMSLALHKENRLKSCHTCDKLRTNVARMWVALYKAKADELLAEQADILLQCKYSDNVSINIYSKTVANDSPNHLSSDDEAEQFEEVLDSVLTNEMENSNNLERQDSQSSDIVKPDNSPLPPLPPEVAEKEPETVDKEKEAFTAGYNPSTAGILDQREAKEYRQRVERLKKKFELDLSGLKTNVDCDVEMPIIESAPVEKPVAKGDAAGDSGDEADRESDNEENISVRPQSKRFIKRNPDRYSPLSDASDDFMVRRPGESIILYF